MKVSKFYGLKTLTLLLAGLLGVSSAAMAQAYAPGYGVMPSYPSGMSTPAEITPGGQPAYGPPSYLSVQPSPSPMTVVRRTTAPTTVSTTTTTTNVTPSPPPPPIAKVEATPSGPVIAPSGNMTGENSEHSVSSSQVTSTPVQEGTPVEATSGPDIAPSGNMTGENSEHSVSSYQVTSTPVQEGTPSSMAVTQIGPILPPSSAPGLEPYSAQKVPTPSRATGTDVISPHLTTQVITPSPTAVYSGQNEEVITGESFPQE